MPGLPGTARGPVFASEGQRWVQGKVRGLRWLVKVGALCSDSGEQGGHSWQKKQPHRGRWGVSGAPRYGMGEGRVPLNWATEGSVEG